MGILLSLILGGGRGTKISMIIFTILLAASGTFIMMKVWEIHSLKGDITELTEKNTKLAADNSILISNNNTLKENQDVLLETNETNQETVRRLDKERNEAKEAIAALAKANQKDRQALDLIGKKIDDMAKDPTNDGPVAPVLRETIRAIQTQRDTK